MKYDRTHRNGHSLPSPLRAFVPSCLRALGFLCLFCSATAHAVTQEEVFKSLNENMHEEPDYSKVIPVVLAFIGVVMVIVYMRQRQRYQAVPKVLRHPGKLQKEMIREVDLDPREMKQLKLKAEELNCEHALTLLLCPSLLGKPDETASPQGDDAEGH